MKTGIPTAFFLAAALPILGQPSASRVLLEHSLGFEDQTSTTLTGWHEYPPGTASADNSVFHTGRWSVRLQRDAGSTGAFSAITRSLPVDFQGSTVELRGYLRLQDVSGNAGLWMRQDADGQMLSLENMQSQQVKGTHDWAQFRIALPMNRKAQQLFFGVLVSGTGTLWADDLELLVDGKPISEAEAAPWFPGKAAGLARPKGGRSAISNWRRR